MAKSVVFVGTSPPRPRDSPPPSSSPPPTACARTTNPPLRRRRIASEARGPEEEKKNRQSLVRKAKNISTSTHQQSHAGKTQHAPHGHVGLLHGKLLGVAQEGLLLFEPPNQKRRHQEHRTGAGGGSQPVSERVPPLIPTTQKPTPSETPQYRRCRTLSDPSIR